MSKLFIELSGRLGNQLHQICAGYAYAYKTFRKPILAVNKFDYQESFKHKFDCCANTQGATVYYPDSFYYYPMCEKLSGDVFMRGYNLSYKYHIDYRNDLIELFQINDSIKRWCDILVSGTHLKSPCSIHIRRDDYVGNPYYEELTTKYYIDAIAKIGDNTDGFIVFSDDIRFAKATLPQLTDKPMYFSETNNPVADMFSMALCPNKILANSSFSFFSAYLSTLPKQNVLYPSKWMYHSGFSLEDYVLPEWTQITV